jgi:hypothetical protein
MPNQITAEPTGPEWNVIYYVQRLGKGKKQTVAANIIQNCMSSLFPDRGNIIRVRIKSSTEVGKKNYPNTDKMGERPK